MKNTREPIRALLREMNRAGVQAYIIPSSDPHMGEYTPEHWKARQYFSGFTGSAGTLVVTPVRSGLWTDGRYFIQAARELLESGIELFRMGVEGVPTVEEFLMKTLAPGDCVGFDGRMLSSAKVKSMQDKFVNKKLSVKSVDLISGLWQDRPPMPNTEIFLHERKFAGLSCQEKLVLLREKLRERHADGQIISRLDCVAWLMNLRASDIEYNPLAVAYAAVFSDEAFLFTELSRVPEAVRSSLSENGVTLLPYGGLSDFLRDLKGNKTLLIEPDGTSYALLRCLDENAELEVIFGDDIITGLKGIKNPIETENIRRAMLYDGCALVKFRVALDARLAAGETVTECDVCDMLREFRAEQPNNRGESFATIAAYRENAAMMHYSPKQGACSALKQSGFLLVDSGGQYPEGTTDITRTFVLGPVSNEERERYTLVLKSHIALATALFLEGSTGGNLDILCREPLWAHGIDYRCGTGHGVGMFSSVHEGPQNIRPKNDTVFRPGMTITNEPGVYEEGKYGIRTENMMLVTEAFSNGYGRFLKFETLTLFPIDTDAVQPKLLTPAETCWLNDYHRTVYEKLSPLLSGGELEWLRKHTRSIG